jgi:Flp pilus assembly protein TadD
MHKLGSAVAVAFLVVMLGCASVPPSPEAEEITAEMLLAGAPFAAEPSDIPPIDDSAVLALDPKMQVFLDRYVNARDGDYIKLQQLVYAMLNEGTFGLDYDDRTRTAAETYRVGRGNCLSFTNMFVALAREAGLDVHYQEVDIPPDWTQQGGTFVLNRHVNAHVDLGLAGEHVVDFNLDDFKASYERRIVSDRRAMAHYFNNIGVERMQAGEPAAAFANFRKALADNDSRFAPAWANLGTLYRREGYPAYAEASYHQALKVNRKDSVAMSNLAALYDAQGDAEQAAYYRDRVTYHRTRNPYYRYQLAREAFLAQDYEAAISHLKYAIRKRETEDAFYFLLGLSYLQTGDQKAARRWLEKAEAVAADERLKRNYQSKLDMLLSSSER